MELSLISQSKYYIVKGRRWFQRSMGNTYHSVVVIDDSTGETLQSNIEYGSHNQYEQTAASLIEQAKWLPERNKRTPLRKWLEDEHNIKLITSVENVPRKKDL